MGDDHISSAGLVPGGNVADVVGFEDDGAASQYVVFWQPDILSSEKRGA